MNARILIVLVALALPQLALATDGQWVLDNPLSPIMFLTRSTRPTASVMPRGVRAFAMTDNAIS
jgi:hypothetical protein